jgi:hypothetical protein
MARARELDARSIDARRRVALGQERRRRRRGDSDGLGRHGNGHRQHGGFARARRRDGGARHDRDRERLDLGGERRVARFEEVQRDDVQLEHRWIDVLRGDLAPIELALDEVERDELPLAHGARAVVELDGLDVVGRRHQTLDQDALARREALRAAIDEAEIGLRGQRGGEEEGRDHLEKAISPPATTSVLTDSAASVPLTL